MDYPRVKERPICILFSHGAVELTNPNPTGPSGVGAAAGSGARPSPTNYEFQTLLIPEQMDIGYVMDPGEIMSAFGNAVQTFCENPTIRPTILEPCFVWHSSSDVKPADAIYKLYSEEAREAPYTQRGISVFEKIKRAKSGSRIGNSVFSFGVKRGEAVGLYTHLPDSKILYATPAALGITDKHYKMSLGEVFAYIQAQPFWNPEVGVNLILLNCHAIHMLQGNIHGRFGTSKLYTIPGLAEKIHALEDLWQTATVNYQTYDLYDRGQLRREYPRIEFPVFMSEAVLSQGQPIATLFRPGEELMEFASEGFLPTNLRIINVNTRKTVKWLQNRNAFLNTIKTQLPWKQQGLLTNWTRKHPRPPNPYVAYMQEQKRKQLEAERRRIKREKNRARMNAMLAKRQAWNYGTPRGRKTRKRRA